MEGVPVYGLVRPRWWQRRRVVRIGGIPPLTERELNEWQALYAIEAEEREMAEARARLKAERL